MVLLLDLDLFLLLTHEAEGEYVLEHVHATPPVLLLEAGVDLVPLLTALFRLEVQEVVENTSDAVQNQVDLVVVLLVQEQVGVLDQQLVLFTLQELFFDRRGLLGVEHSRHLLFWLL